MWASASTETFGNATKERRGERSRSIQRRSARRCNPCLSLCGWRREMATRTEGSALSLVGGGRAGGEEEDHRVDEIKSFSLVWSERRRPTSQVNRQRSGQILTGRRVRVSCRNWDWDWNRGAIGTERSCLAGCVKPLEPPSRSCATYYCVYHSFISTES